MRVNFLEGELWYPAVSEYGIDMPYDGKYRGRVSFLNNPTTNQMTPLLLSNKGRVLYHPEGFNVEFKSGTMDIDREIYLTGTYIDEDLGTRVYVGDFKDEYKSKTCGNLKSAFKYISKEFAGEKHTNKIFIEKPVYNTWMYMPYELNSDIVCSYVDNILKDGLEKGVIIIDDKWSKSYGDWVFDEKKFENPRELTEYIHNKGFKLMLWVCPYIDFDAGSYEFCKSRGFLLENEAGEVYELEWWNGKSACFDFRKKEVIEFWREILGNLQKIGADGFKFDGGDARFYLESHEPDRQSYLWAKLASEYELNEIRADFNTGALAVFERVSDKRHNWSHKGVAGIIPAGLALGLGGHQIFSPDMIGGGEVEDIREKCLLKEDIFMAHMQTALCMPNMQFSVLPKKVLGENYNKFLKLLSLRNKYRDYISDLYEKSKHTGEPLIRLLEYEFPKEGYGYEKSAFMLGDKYLVIPLDREEFLNSGRDFRLPKGIWEYKGKRYAGGEFIHIDFDLYELTVFEKMD